jgi:hypothetical protein
VIPEPRIDISYRQHGLLSVGLDDVIDAWQGKKAAW